MVFSIFSMVFIWFSYGFPMVFRCFYSTTHFTRDPPGIFARRLRRLAKGHQLATADQEARQDDQHATWKDERDK